MKRCALLMASCAGAFGASVVTATSLPVVNPGFNGTVTGTGFSYEGHSIPAGSAIPDHTYSLPLGPVTGGFGDTILGDSATGATIPGSTVNIPGWVGTGETGILYDSRDFVAGQGPTGPAGLVSGPPDNAPRGMFQTLTGTSFLPLTTYTLAVQISDRRFGGGDNVTLPSNIQLTIIGSTGDLVGVQTFVPPTAGGTSLATFVMTTGAVAPAGDVVIGFRAAGFAGGAASQAIFDNVTLDASPVPEPTSATILALCGVTGTALTRRHRRRQ